MPLPPSFRTVWKRQWQFGTETRQRLKVSRPVMNRPVKGTFLLRPGWEQKLESQKEDKKLANRTYEVMYIIDPDAAADKVENLNEAVGKLIEKEGGTVGRMDDIGRREVAYPINQ